MDQEISQEDIQKAKALLAAADLRKGARIAECRVRLHEAAKQYVETYAKYGGEANTALIIDERELEQSAMNLGAAIDQD